MANVQITQLPAAQPLTGTESVPVVQNGITVQTTTGAIANAPVQTQTFLTVNNEPTLPNSRYFAEGLGIGLVDNGAQSYYRIALNGVSASLETATNGFIAKTGAIVTPRALTVTGNGISVTNGDGQAGNPIIQLTGLANSIATQAGNGLIALNGSSAYTPVSIVGVTNQISVLNGNAAGANNPTIGLSNDPIVPGVAAITVPTGNTAQRPSGVAGQIRYNTDLNQFEGYSAGAWRVFSASGGISTFSAGTTGLLPNTPTGGTIVLSGVVNTSSGGTGVAGTLSGYIKGNGSSPMTSVAAIPTSDISGLGTMAIQNANSVAITGGSISGVALTLDSLDNTPIGVTTPSSGFFTGISATSGTINGDTIATLTASQILTNKTISGSSNTLTNIGNSSLTNSAVTINGTTVNLGGSITVTAASPNPLTIGTGLTGSSYNGVVPVTIAIDNTVATLTGAQTLTNKTISGSNNTLSNIGNSSLTNSAITINGTPVSLGGSVTVTASSPYALTIGTGLSGTSYNGSAPVTITNTGVTSFSTDTTGLTVTSSTGNITLGGTLNVANGGTGVTASSGPNSVVLRDANANESSNAFFAGFTSVAASGTQIVLTASSTPVYVVTGSGGQTIKLPDATTLPNGAIFSFNNNQTSGAITVNNNSNTLVASVPSGGYSTIILLSNASAAGSWDRHDQSPSNVSWSTNTFNYPGSITGTTWNGVAIGAIYGGTGQTSYATGDTLYASATNTLSKLTGNTTTTKKFLTQTGTGSASAAPAWGTVSAGDISGLGTMATQNANSVTITGGTIDGVTIGGTTPAAGTFTVVTATSGIYGGSF
jgi:trimeric autotransporter adhesin